MLSKLIKKLTRIKTGPPFGHPSVGQRGQSLVEFVMLMSVIMLISLGYLRVVSGNVAEIWLGMGQVLVEDETQKLELR